MNEIPLRGNHWTFDRRLDCILDSFDPRNRIYGIAAQVPKEKGLRNAVWPIPSGRHLDQGNMGMCVGCGFTHALQAFPTPRAGLDIRSARKLYYGAQRHDDMPGGEYSFWCRPKYSGTTVGAGADETKREGFIEAYRWALSLDDLLSGLSWFGGAVLGIPWTEGMEDIDKDGISHPGGKEIGGHCIYAYSIEVRSQKSEVSRQTADPNFIVHPSSIIVSLWQSWGTRGGRNGIYHVTADDLWNLMKGYRGQACFLEGKKPCP